MDGIFNWITNYLTYQRHQNLDTTSSLKDNGLEDDGENEDKEILTEILEKVCKFLIGCTIANVNSLSVSTVH